MREGQTFAGPVAPHKSPTHAAAPGTQRPPLAHAHQHTPRCCAVRARHAQHCRRPRPGAASAPRLLSSVSSLSPPTATPSPLHSLRRHHDRPGPGPPRHNGAGIVFGWRWPDNPGAGAATAVPPRGGPPNCAAAAGRVRCRRVPRAVLLLGRLLARPPRCRRGGDRLGVLEGQGREAPVLAHARGSAGEWTERAKSKRGWRPTA